MANILNQVKYGLTSRTSSSQNVINTIVGNSSDKRTQFIGGLAGATVEVGLDKLSSKISNKLGTSIDLNTITWASAANIGTSLVSNKLLSGNSMGSKILRAAIDNAGGLNAILGIQGSPTKQIDGFEAPLSFDFYIIPYWGRDSSGSSIYGGPSDKIVFWFEPENFSDSLSANYNSESIIGRAGDILGYNNTSNRQISFSVQLHDDYPKGQLLSTVRKLQALEFPEYGQDITYAPYCFLKIGTMVNSYFICTGVNVTWHKPMRVIDGNQYYVLADVSLSFKQIVEIPPSASDIQGGIYEGSSSTNKANAKSLISGTKFGEQALSIAKRYDNNASAIASGNYTQIKF